MKLTIITVCYCAQNTIEATLKSLLIQTYQDYEYLIIDGKSKDSTLKILEQYKTGFHNIKILSENDKGIYDAMNKGINLAHGDYILFLNAGDVLANKNVLSRFIKLMQKNIYDIIYGKMLWRANNIIQKRAEIVGVGMLLRCATLCHQVIFAKRELLLEYRFNTIYELCADRDWIYYCIKKRKRFKFYPYPVCIYDMNGISSQETMKKQLNEEREQILRYYFPLIYKTRKILLNIRSVLFENKN